MPLRTPDQSGPVSPHGSQWTLSSNSEAVEGGWAAGWQGLQGTKHRLCFQVSNAFGEPLECWFSALAAPFQGPTSRHSNWSGLGGLGIKIVQSFPGTTELRNSLCKWGFATVLPGSLLAMQILRPHSGLVNAQVIRTWKFEKHLLRIWKMGRTEDFQSDLWSLLIQLLWGKPARTN